jgi:uncharacterized protein
MSARCTNDSEQVAAGAFGQWLSEMRAALRGEGGTDVPCGDCVGCCVSSYYIPVRSQDKDAIAAIPADQLIHAPGQPSGHFMMGYREDGTCPMLNCGKCSIYHARPQTCRDYDCRIFAAAGIDAGSSDKDVINHRVRSWRFTYESADEEKSHEAIRTAATFIQTNAASFPGKRAPTAPTGIAVLAVKSYAIFLSGTWAERPAAEVAAAIVDASGKFDAAGQASAD